MLSQNKYRFVARMLSQGTAAEYDQLRIDGNNIPYSTGTNFQYVEGCRLHSPCFAPRLIVFNTRKEVSMQGRLTNIEGVIFPVQFYLEQYQGGSVLWPESDLTDLEYRPGMYSIYWDSNIVIYDWLADAANHSGSVLTDDIFQMWITYYERITKK